MVRVADSVLLHLYLCRSYVKNVYWGWPCGHVVKFVRFASAAWGFTGSDPERGHGTACQDRKSTRLNSSHANLVCRLLLEKKKNRVWIMHDTTKCIHN